jgi:hypothetical protein
MRVNRVAVAIALAALVGAGTARAQSVTVFEGARLIVGDGRVIENGALVVDGVRITQAGAAAGMQVPG